MILFILTFKKRMIILFNLSGLHQVQAAKLFQMELLEEFVYPRILKIKRRIIRIIKTIKPPRTQLLTLSYLEKKAL